MNLQLYNRLSDVEQMYRSWSGGETCPCQKVPHFHWCAKAHWEQRSRRWKMSSPSLIQLQSDSPQGEASLLAELQEIVGGYPQWSDGGSWEKQARRWGDVVREKEPHRAALQLLPKIKATKRRKRSLNTFLHRDGTGRVPRCFHKVNVSLKIRPCLKMGPVRCLKRITKS